MTIPEPASSMEDTTAAVWWRGVFIATIAFLTLIDLFGAQALLPMLVEAYDTTPANMGVAVNACTIGMAVAGLVIAIVGRSLDRKFWIWMSLAMLSVPTVLLGVVDNITLFATLRVIQGLFMAAAFTMTITYLSERCTVTAATGAMAAYITGNVASNLFGRMIAVGFADRLGLPASFYAFATLNLVGAALAFIYFSRSSDDNKDRVQPNAQTNPEHAWTAHLKNPALAASFGIGFLVLFVFIGVFT
ncbi:MAG: MFS transporter, partial [Hyphomicrobiaceae bacterium]